MQPTADIISLLRSQSGKFPNREQQVADYISEHLEEVTTIALSDLAHNVGVSEPTVIRFCRTLGCDGFRDFKMRLAQNLAVSMQYLTSEDISDDTTAADVLRSEEHTSELQSHHDLVCRLLLEKKNKHSHE